MKKIFFLVFLSVHAFAADNAIEKLTSKFGLKKEDLSLYATIEENGEPKVLLDLNSTQKKIPASITKIATAAAAFHYYPPGSKFKTQLWTKGKIHHGVLKGDLYLKGGGDPSFVSENMWVLVNNFTRTGVSKIEGSIIVDDTLFDSVRYDTSREDIRVDRAYDAPVGAMSFNWNSINIYVRPGSMKDKANVYLDPQNEYTKLVNKTKTVAGQQNNIIVERKDGKDKKTDEVIVSGTIGERSKEQTIYKNITRPDWWSGYHLKSFLAQRNIFITGEVKTGVLPTESELVAEAESKPIEMIIADMNKFSNNYVAEMICKNIALSQGKLATLSNGMELIRSYIDGLGLDRNQYVLLNPSGLTRENQMSSFFLWKILSSVKKNFQIYPEFLSSLPIAGVDGTLKKRLNGTKGERWVRGKTGQLNGVYSLAGFAGKPDGKVVTFVFIYNGSKDGVIVRNYFDQVILELFI